MVRSQPAIWETWVRSLDWDDPLEKEMATLSNMLAWKIPWMEKPGWLQSMGLQKMGHNLGTKQQQFIFFPFILIHWRLVNLQYCSGFCHTLT